MLNTGFNVRGKGFQLIPDDALGLFSNNNNVPLEHLDDNRNQYLYYIAERSANELSFLCGDPTTAHGANYLAAIVSNDRETIYWVNDSKPLP